MKNMQFKTKRRWIAGMAVFLCGLCFSPKSDALIHFGAINAAPTGATSSLNVGLPPGIKVVAQLPLQGPPATHMYTQWEHGKTYWYVEQGSVQLTTVDITKTRYPRVVSHQPEAVSTAQNLIVAEGGPLEVSRPQGAIAGVDNVRDSGTFSVLQPDDPEDAQLLRLFGRQTSNLVDRDHHLVFFASATRLLIVEDARWNGETYIIN